MLSVVAVDKAGGCQAAFFRRHQDAIHGSEEARIVWRDEEHERGDEDGGVKKVARLVTLHEAT